jgi:hypothetical protein
MHFMLYQAAKNKQSNFPLRGELCTLQSRSESAHSFCLAANNAG